MKHIISNGRNVPSIPCGCSLAETGRSEYDDYDNPLKALKVIPEGTEDRWLDKAVEYYTAYEEETVEVVNSLKPGIDSPSDVRDEGIVTITIPKDVHPIEFLKKIVANSDRAWIFVNESIVETLRKLPTKYHQNTVAYGEFFRFENLDTISLQAIEYFDDWKVILDWEFDGEKFTRVDVPEFIIQLELRD